MFTSLRFVCFGNQLMQSFWMPLDGVTCTSAEFISDWIRFFFFWELLKHLNFIYVRRCVHIHFFFSFQKYRFDSEIDERYQHLQYGTKLWNWKWIFVSKNPNRKFITLFNFGMEPFYSYNKVEPKRGTNLIWS